VPRARRSATSGPTARRWWSSYGLASRFHDGTPVDAAAVKYSLERHGNMAAVGTRRATSPASNASRSSTRSPSASSSRRPTWCSSPSSACAPACRSRPRRPRRRARTSRCDPVCAGPYKFAERVAQDRIVHRARA
jgi:peptide/nickel transport system substrate-binding protein